MNLEKRVKELEEKLSKALKRIEELESFEKENKLLKKRIEELEAKSKEKSVPAFVKEDVKHYCKKSGQKEGHEGVSREIPERIDEIKKWDIKKCPDCGTKLSKIQRVRKRYITDIKVKTINTKNIIHGRYCKTCDKIIEPKVTDALPNSRFGLKLMLLVLMMKLDSRVPSNKIVSILNSIFGIKISDGEIYGILKQLKTAFGDYHQEIVQKIKEALVKHVDETSWRINGKNNWLWIFINKEAALYAVKKQRSNEVPKKILGNQEGKIVVSDRLFAYDQLAKESKNFQQICWTHLLRNSKDLAEHYKEAKYIHKRMKYIYNKAKEGECKEKLLRWIDLIASKKYHGTEVPKFVRSVCKKHREDLFRFVDNPKIESTNNRAERGLRHAVVIRKISNGSRSEEGAETTANLLSILQTAKIQGDNSMNFMLNLLQKAK